MAETPDYYHTIKQKIDFEKKVYPPCHAPNYKGNKKLAICGLANTTRDMAPFDDPTFDIWTVHMGSFILRRVDVAFEFHDPEVFSKPQYNDKEYYEKLKTLQIPIFMQKHYEDIPTSIPFPIESITKQFGRFFTNSIAYMLALAFRNQYEEVHVYGVEMEHGSEYVDQARSVIYFTGLLMGVGVKVTYPQVCQLFKNRWLYGFETAQSDEDIQKIESRRKELGAQLAHEQQEVNNHQMAMFQIQGAINESELMNRRILQTDPH